MGQKIIIAVVSAAVGASAGIGRLLLLEPPSTTRIRAGRRVREREPVGVLKEQLMSLGWGAPPIEQPRMILQVDEMHRTFGETQRHRMGLMSAAASAEPINSMAKS